MKIVVSEDSKQVAIIREGLAKNEGYCPCRLENTPETKCMCLEFRNQLRDPEFYGLCHCGLYEKIKE